MSTEIHTVKDGDSGLFVTSYFGGKDEGQRLQFTVTGNSSWWAQHTTLGYPEVEAMATALNQWLQDRAPAQSSIGVEVGGGSNEKLQALAERYDKGEFTDRAYLIEITRVIQGDLLEIARKVVGGAA